MKWFFILALTTTLPVLAHDEGHGPKLTDAPKQGGVVAPVVLAKDAGLGTKAPLRYKAEIVRSLQGAVRVFFYDKDMNPLKPGLLAPKAKGNLISGKKGKVTQQQFALEWKADRYEGLSPKPTRKPYNIDVTVAEGGTDLLVAFDNLD